MSEPVGVPAYAAPRVPHPDAVTVLVLGIVGVAFPILSFGAWFMGNRALRDVRDFPERYDNADLIRVGRMLGKVMGILTLLSLVLFVAVLAYYVIPAER